MAQESGLRVLSFLCALDGEGHVGESRSSHHVPRAGLTGGGAADGNTSPGVCHGSRSGGKHNLPTPSETLTVLNAKAWAAVAVRRSFPNQRGAQQHRRDFVYLDWPTRVANALFSTVER